MLKLIRTNNFGANHYHFDGVFPFNWTNNNITQKLEVRDSITDNNGNGITMYVNVCYQCDQKFLSGTFQLGQSFCSKVCSEKNRYYSRLFDAIMSGEFELILSQDGPVSPKVQSKIQAVKDLLKKS